MVQRILPSMDIPMQFTNLSLTKLTVLKTRSTKALLMGRLRTVRAYFARFSKNPVVNFVLGQGSPKLYMVAWYIIIKSR